MKIKEDGLNILKCDLALKQTHWVKAWGIQYNFYLPILLHGDIFCSVHTLQYLAMGLVYNIGLMICDWTVKQTH